MDDAAVIKISNDLALVLTVDFFTPVVDDAYDFGTIAAANALSDVYAMGAKPVAGLNIVSFPTEAVKIKVLENILRGGADKAKEAGIPIVGGHTVDDAEPKYGLAVAGLINPSRIISAAGGKTGDVLVLTKPVGTGIITTAIKRGSASRKDIKNVVTSMSALNKIASECMVKTGVNACTDVTGFGLIGHLRTMTSGSKLRAKVYADSVPLLDNVKAYVEKGIFPGGARRNLEFFTKFTTWNPVITENEKLILSDPQTSGGLLIAVARKKSGKLMDSLKKSGISPVIIGELTDGRKGRIYVEGRR